ISLETVTPSLVTVGPPNDLLRMTLRPVGPSVVPTAWARISMPSSILRRAASAKSSCLAMREKLLEGQSTLSGDGIGRLGRVFDVPRQSHSHRRASKTRPTRLPILHPSARGGFGTPAPSISLDDLRQDVGLAEDLDLLAVDLDLGSRVFAEEDFI